MSLERGLKARGEDLKSLRMRSLLVNQVSRSSLSIARTEGPNIYSDP